MKTAMSHQKRDFRSFYYFHLGVQGVNIKTVELLMKEKVIDLTRLREYCIKCQMSNQLRCKIYKILIGVLPTVRKSWPFVSQQLYEQYRDIYSTMLVIQPDIFSDCIISSSSSSSNSRNNSSSLLETDNNHRSFSSTVTIISRDDDKNNQQTQFSQEKSQPQQQEQQHQIGIVDCDVLSDTSSTGSSGTSSQNNEIDRQSEQIFALYKLHKLMFSEIRDKMISLKNEHQTLLSAQEEKYHVLRIIKLLMIVCEAQKLPKQHHDLNNRLMADTYWCFSFFMEKYFGPKYSNWRDCVYWLTGELVKQIEQTDKRFYSLISSHGKNSGSSNNNTSGDGMGLHTEIEKVFAGWFTSMFSSFLSIQKTLRLWDCILLFPIEFVSNVALSYTKRISAKLFSEDDEEADLMRRELDLPQITFHLVQIEEYDIESIILMALEMNKK